MADIDTIQSGIAGVLDAISGIRASAEWPDTITVPSGGAVAWPVLSSAVYSVTMGGDDALLEFDVLVIVAQGAGIARAQGVLNDYVSSTGSKSVSQALRLSGTLGGTVSGVQMVQLKSYGQLTVGGDPYVGAIFGLAVMAE